MSEIPQEPKKITRGKFILSAAAATASALLGEAVGFFPTIVADTQNLGKDLSQSAAKVSQEIFQGKEFTILLEDHIPPAYGDMNLCRIGELIPSDLQLDSHEQTYQINTAPKKSSSVFGYEYEMSQARVAQKYAGINTPAIVASLDGRLVVHPEALVGAIENSEIVKYAAIFGVTYAGLSLEAGVGAVSGVYKGETLELSRRRLLKGLGVAVAAGVAAAKLGSAMPHQQPDLSGFPASLQEAYRLFSVDDSINLRNKCMALNGFSLKTLQLSQMTDTFELFAGSGHTGVLSELQKEPHVLEQELVTDIRDRLDGFGKLYLKYIHDQGASVNIIAVASNIFAGAFAPVFLRINNPDGTRSLDNIRQHVQENTVNSTYAVFFKTLTEKIHKLQTLRATHSNDPKLAQLETFYTLIAQTSCNQYMKMSLGRFEKDFQFGLPVTEANSNNIAMIGIGGYTAIFAAGHLAKLTK